MADSAMKAMQAQASVRRNAEEMNDFLRGMQSWEKQMKVKDKTILQQRKEKRSMPPVRASGGTVHTQLSTAPRVATPTASSAAKASAPDKPTAGASAAAHTYDKGYKRWESFDVDAALDEVDTKDQGSEPEEQQVSTQPPPNPSIPPPRTVRKATPATILHQSADGGKGTSAATVPRPKAAAETPAEKEKRERDKGNEAFRKGDFQAAIRSYTACIGLSNRSVAAFSNRSMCYIKLKEWRKAVTDATLALKVDPHHTKSLQRRAVARNALGMHRAALGDLDLAATQADASALKSVAAEQRKTRELLKAAMRSAPRTRVPVLVSSSPALPPAPSTSHVKVEGNTDLPRPEEALRESLSARATNPESAQETAAKPLPPAASVAAQVTVPAAPHIPANTPPAAPMASVTTTGAAAPSSAGSVKLSPSQQEQQPASAKPKAKKKKKQEGAGKGKKGKGNGLRAGDPKGHFELERMWRSMPSSADRNAFARKVLRADGAVANALFGDKSLGTLDAGILVDVLEARIDASLPLESQAVAADLAASLRALACAPRFASSAMFMSKQQQDTLRAKVEDLLSTVPPTMSQAEVLREATSMLLAACV